jgi:hypothetical protein
VKARALGVLLFLPVPLVLWLFTRMPVGPLPSLGLGILLVASHRLYARPFALARAQRRCLWCGAQAEQGPELVVEEPLGVTRWRACRAEHAGRLGRVFGFAASHATFLRVGILGTLLLFLLAALAAGLDWLWPAASADAVAFFRLGIAVTVLPLGWLSAARGVASTGTARTPFPLHIQALIGTAAVLWLFRLIGLAWFALGVFHVAGRIGSVPA